MRGKHGRYRPGQPDDGELTAGLITESGHSGSADASNSGSSAAAPGSTTNAVPPARGALWVPGGTTFHPPSARLAPTPPSLPPIRTAPLPEYVAAVQDAEPAASSDSVDDDDDDDEGGVEEVVEGGVVEQSRADLLAAAAAVRLAAHFPAAIAASVPVTDAPVTTVPVSNVPVSNVPVSNVPVSNVPVTNVPVTNTLGNGAAVRRPNVAVHPLDRASNAALPSTSVRPGSVETATEPRHDDPILPSKRSSARGSGNDDKSGRSRWLIVGLVVLLVAALGVLFLPSSKKKAVTAAPPTPSGVSGRAQTTLLIQLSGNFGGAIDSALVAHDSAAKTGTVVLVPSNVIAQVPGFGSMPFGEAVTVGDPGAARAALADLVGVTVDGSWTLTPAALAALVDKLGGVTVQVDRDVTKVAGDTTTIVIAAGMQKLAGSAAVTYASFLAPGETEQARLARFDAVLQQVLAGLPHDQPGLATSLASLGSGSVSSFPVAQLSTVLAGLAADSSASALTDQLLPVTDLQSGNDQQSYTLDSARTAALVSAQFASSVPTSRTATGNRVYVQNQVGTPGLGESTRDKLQHAGFQYVHGENTQDMPNTQDPSAVVIFGQTAAKIAEGRAVAAALGLPAADVKISQVGFAAADVVVKLGADYKQ